MLRASESYKRSRVTPFAGSVTNDSAQPTVLLNYGHGTASKPWQQFILFGASAYELDETGSVGTAGIVPCSCESLGQLSSERHFMWDVDR